ncbi:hypothetical protein Tco_0849776 [Tanacetum coccineum]
MNSAEPTLSSRPTNVEVPTELPKVSMVNTSLKKLKHHLAGFDVVVKERTTPTAIIEGSWGFEHTKACFRDEIIPFVKALKDAVEQHRLESKTFEVKMNQVLNENERLLEQVINKDIVNVIMNSSADIASVNVHECEKCLKLETELQTDFIEKEIYDKLFKTLKDDLRKLKGKALVDNDVTKHPSDPEMLKIDVEPIAPKLYAKLVQELLTNISKTCPRVKPSTSASGSQPSGNTKKDKIRQTPSSTQKNKVEAHPRKVKSSLKNKDYVVESKGTAHVQHSKLNENSELKRVKCNGCMLSANHDLCVLDFINNVNGHNKSKSVKKSLKRKV